MRRVVLSQEAKQDLIEAWYYVAEQNPEAADGLIRRLRLAADLLAETPGAGHMRADVQDRRYRFWAVRPYLIAYRYDPTTLTILRVVHGARDLRRLFSER